MDPSSDHGQLSYQLSYSLDFPSSVPRSGCVINNRTLDVGRETHEAILDNEYLLIGDADGVVRVWRITPHSTVEVLNDIICHEGAVMDVVGSSLTDATVDLDAYQEGAMSITAVEATLSFFTCGRDHKIHRVNFLGQRLTTYVGHSDVVCSLQEFDRGQRLVSGSWDGTAIVWDVSTGSMLYRVGGNTYKYSVYCNVLPNGDLVTAMTNGDLCIWNNGTLRKTLQAHSGVIRAVSIKDDTILTCSNDCSVRCFNGNMESLYTIPAAHENFVYDVRHSMYVPIFFTASEDKTVGIWDLVSGRQLQLIHLDSSIWKVVETCQGICIIPMSGNVSIWQRLPGCDLTLHPPQVVYGTMAISVDHSTAHASYDMVSFKKANAQKAMEYLQLYNDSKPSQLRVSPKDMDIARNAFSGTISPSSDLTFIYKMIQWPMEELLPVFDLLKLVCLDTSSSKLFGTRSNGYSIVKSVYTTISNSATNPALLAVSLQFMCNMFHLTMPRSIILSHIDETLIALKESAPVVNKLVQQAHSSCVQNLVIIAGERASVWAPDIASIVDTAISVLYNNLDTPWAPSVIVRHCKLLETLISLDKNAVGTLKQVGLHQKMEEIAEKLGESDSTTLNAVKHLCELL